MISASEQEELSEGAAEAFRETELGALKAVAGALSAAAEVGVAVAGIKLSAKLGQYLARRSEAHSGAVSASMGKVFEANAKAGPGYDKAARADAGNRAREACAAAKPRVAEIERAIRSDANSIYAKHAARAAQDARVMGYERALRKAVVGMAEEGVAAYSYKRKDGTVVRVPVDVGVRRMMHTEATQRLIAQELDIAQRNGRNLVKVNTTANARPSHAAWQGRVYQIKGSGEYPNFYDCCHPGDMQNGIGGYNCGHRVEIYYPGTASARPDPLEGTGYTAEEARDLTSRQRRYENDIRKRKRVIEVLEDAGYDAADERRRLRTAEGKLRELVEEHSAVLRRQKPYREGTYRKARAKAGAEGVVHVESKASAHVFEHLNSGSMASDRAPIEWPEAGAKMSSGQRGEIKRYAEEKGISLRLPKHSDADPAVLKGYVDAADRVASLFPELRGTAKKPLTIEVLPMPGDDFAFSPSGASHVIQINSASVRSLESLASEYGKLVDSGWFVSGTSWEAVIYHEMGHMYASRNKISGMRIARSIIGSKEWPVVKASLISDLSEYSASFRNGGEIVSEVFAAWMSSTNNSFAQKFMKKLQDLR